MFCRFLNILHRIMARSRVLVHGGIMIRNQMQRIIALSVADGADPMCSGEAELLTAVLPLCNLVVDVGANMGDWSSVVLEKEDPASSPVHVYAYEPGHSVLKHLQDRFHSDSRVVIRGVAVGAGVGTLHFHERLDHSTLSSLTDPGDHANVKTYDVDIVCLDDEAEVFGWRQVDFLKIDAEGHDAAVMQGAARLLQEGRIRFLQFEYNSNWSAAGYTLTHVRRLLEELGYKLFLIKRTGLVELDWVRYGEYFSYSNIFVVREADAALMQSLVRFAK